MGASGGGVRPGLAVAALLATLCLPAHAVADAPAPCPFDGTALSFRGTPREQARCLLRPVLPYGQLGPPLERLPEPLASRIGEPVRLAPESLRRYLGRKGVDASELGGDLERPVSRANGNAPDAPSALYFVIHDTSWPVYAAREAFPPEIDTPAWRHNDLRLATGDRRLAHVFVNRVGASRTQVAFDVPWRATKFELHVLGPRSKGRFLHIELIQPRREDAEGVDADAPEPGFTEAQLERLALVYAAASLRAGTWLVPAYHAVLDAGIPNAHDDPQHFALGRFALHVGELIAALERPDAGPG